MRYLMILVFTALAGCTEAPPPVIDGSSVEAFNQSVKTIAEKLPAEDRKEFLQNLGAVQTFAQRRVSFGKELSAIELVGEYDGMTWQAASEKAAPMREKLSQ